MSAIDHALAHARRTTTEGADVIAAPIATLALFGFAVPDLPRACAYLKRMFPSQDLSVARIVRFGRPSANFPHLRSSSV
jgi:hypothetical protein